MQSFADLFSRKRKDFEDFFYKDIFKEIETTFNPKLAEACIYSLKAGGKRIRPVLVIAGFQAGENLSDLKNAFFAGSGIECIHTYSLIHDDLPSMDNDDYRRGMLTCHKKFSEAAAILAGDALNSYGFYLISKLIAENGDTTLHRDIGVLLHEGAGGPGMVSGQMEDIQYENQPLEFTPEVLKSIHRKKTGALILSSLLIGNRLKKDWKEKERFFREYGEKIGLLFQITDDIIDEEGSFEDLGKTPGKDAAKGKLTYPALFGMDKSKLMRDEIKSELVELSIKIENQNEIFFKELPVYIAERKN